MSELYLFAKELITNEQGNVINVVHHIEDYQLIVETLDNEGLLGTMKEVQDDFSYFLDDDGGTSSDKDENIFYSND